MASGISIEGLKVKSNPDCIKIDKHLRQYLAELRNELESCSISCKALEKFNELEEILGQETDYENNRLVISAQVSLYPLRVKTLTPFINKAIEIFENYGLDIFPGSMSTIVSGNSNAVWQALRAVFTNCAQETDLVMPITVSNACPPPK